MTIGNESICNNKVYGVLHINYDFTAETPNFRKGGVSGKGKDMISKHDATICGKKNAKKVLDRFPPEFDTGDCDAIDMKLSNQVSHLQVCI